MRKCLLLLILVLAITIVVGDVSILDLILLAFLGYACGVSDSVQNKVREPYIIGDSSEIVYLTKEELKKRMED